MYFENRYKEIIKSKKDLPKNTEIENSIVNRLRIQVGGHFGNCVSFSLCCRDCCPPAFWNNTKNIGYILSFLIDFFDKTEEDGADIDKAFLGMPVRLVFENGSKCIGIGHFIEDRFVLFDELCKLEK